MANKKKPIKQQEEIKALLDFNQKILDTAPCSIITIDKNGILTFVNRHFYNFSSSTSPLNRDVFKLPFFINEGLCEPLKKLLKDGTPFSKDNCRTVNSEGESKYLNVIHVPLRNANNEITGALSMAIDNSEVFKANKKLEEWNQKLEKKIIERTRQLDLVNKKLAKALDLKTKFIADASHELRTPLTIIQGNIELALLKSCENNRALKENLNLIKNEVKFMSGLITDLTLIANIDSGVKEANREKVNLIDLIKGIIRSHKVIAEEKNISFDFKKDFDSLEIVGDRNKLEILFLNIIRNAIKYGKRGGQVKIWTEKFFSEIVINIEDDGMGIDEQDLPYIFSRFYRSSVARASDESGSGLGLAICKRIAEAHRGSIAVKSKLGAGSIFSVYLPVDYSAREDKG